MLEFECAFHGASPLAGVTIIDGVSGVPALSSSCDLSTDSPRGTVSPIMTWRSEGERAWSCLSWNGVSSLAVRNEAPVPFWLFVSGNRWKPRETLLLNVSFDF